MPLRLVSPQAPEGISISSEEEFETTFDVKYLAHVEWENHLVMRDVSATVGKRLKRGWITPHQKWLGQFYRTGIENPVGHDLTICWIDSQIGYGLWTNREIPPRAYLGEYTGVLRKRHLFGRWQNNYCFIYNIGEARGTSYLIDAEKKGNFTRFINHSETPNLEAASVYHNGCMHIIFYAIQKIPANTQLCYDYGPLFWRKRKIPLSLCPKSSRPVELSL